MSASASASPGWPLTSQNWRNAVPVERGGELAPQQLAAELVVEPGHVGLDHPRRGLQQRDAVGLDVLDAGQEQRTARICWSPSYIGSAKRGSVVAGASGSGRVQVPAGASTRACARASTVVSGREALEQLGAQRVRRTAPGGCPPSALRGDARPSSTIPFGGAGRRRASRP